MPYIEEHQLRVMGLIDEMFAARLALVRIKQAVEKAQKEGTLTQTIMIDGMSINAYLAEQLKAPTT